MGLNDYFRKRDFRQTPEPRHGSSKKGTALRFVVQKHDASHLHYDFRLENHGVLRSWAIPKGFSMNPSDKRLAVQVEDHPYEYRNFEENIPAGNYGAGEVIIWDEGTYTAGGQQNKEALEDYVHRAIEKGHIEFDLNGKKLRGRFMLVKLRRTPNQWLLFKKSDEFASESHIFDEASVKTGKLIDSPKEHRSGGKKNKPAESLEDLDLSKARKSPLPEAIEPMLATLTDRPFNRKKWAFEIKWDGYRCLSQIKDGDVRLYSRNNITQNDRFKTIVSALKGFRTNAVFDGEIVIMEGPRSNFQMLQNYIRTGKGRLVYYIFDILYFDEFDLRPLPLRTRRSILEKVLNPTSQIKISDFIEEHGEALFREAKKNEWEGVIAKDLESPYLTGTRSPAWLKIKNQKTQEAVICGFTAPRSSRKYFGSVILGVYKDGELTYIGNAGSGFTDDDLQQFHARFKELETSKSPFRKPPKLSMPITWIKPILLCEVKFNEWTAEGIMRQPVFLGLREDKDAREIGVETAVPIAKVVEQTEAPLQKSRAALTHPEKIFWPDEGFTKKDVFEYYRSVAPWMLPHVKDRPNSLRRQPDGITDEGFFHKNISTPVPGWVKTMKIASDSERHGGSLNYIITQNEDTLLYLANLGCIEINVWNSTIHHLENPDIMVIDLDPQEAPFSKVVEAGLAARQLLDDLELPAFLKTSGSRGLHIFVPIVPNLKHEDTKNISRLIGFILEHRHPKLITNDKSEGMVYVDYLQNKHGATMAAAYSIRPKPAAPVSTPIGWSELKKDFDFKTLNLRTVVERLKRSGDVWSGMREGAVDLRKYLSRIEDMFNGKDKAMAKYGPKAQESVGTAMKEFKQGKLKSGRGGKKVTNPKQAVAIGLSEARKKGVKMPKRKK